MAICDVSCQLLPTAWAANCARQTRRAGIDYFVVMSCDLAPSVTDLEDSTWWCTQITAGTVAISPALVGEKPAPSYTTARFRSCVPEEVQGRTNTINFMSYEVENTNSGTRSAQFKDFNFWNDFQANYRRYQIGYIDCNGNFFGIITDFAAQVANTLTNTGDEAAKWEGNITWQSLQELKPYYVANLVGLLQGGCPP